MAYIGLDLGSTYTKIALLNEDGTGREKRIPAPPRMHVAPERYEIDADAYFAQVVSLLDQYAAEGTQGILLSTQMHGYVLADAHFRPLTPYVSWQDRVGVKHLAAIREAFTLNDVEPSGVPLKANLALCSLWGRMQEGFQIPRGAGLCSLGGYIIGRLTGRRICHMTNAAPTGMADVRRKGWNLPLLRKAGLEALVLPEISVDMRPVGTWKGIPVFPDLGDQQVCAAGAVLTLDHCLHVSVGTAGLIGVLTEEWGAGPFENRPWLTPGRYLRTVSGLPGGRNVAMFKDAIAASLPIALSEDEIWRLMTTLDASGLPEQMMGGLVDRIEAFYLEMAKSYRQSAERMERRITRLSFSGGCVAKNPELRRKLADAFHSAAFTAQDHDVMLGFQAIIAQLEEYQ